MVPEKGANADLAADPGVVTARRAERDRLAIARRDFLLGPAARLSEQERSAMDRMLRRLLDGLAQRLGDQLPQSLAAAGPADDRLVERLGAAGLLDRGDLIGLLLRFAAAERVSGAAAVAEASAGRDGAGQGRLIEQLAEDRQPAIAAAAAALAGAHDRRRDLFGQRAPLIDDLSEPLAQALAHSVAAALRRPLLGAASAGDVDVALGSGVAHLLAERDGGRSVEALAAALVAALDGAGRLDDQFAVRAGAAGEFELLVAMLARRAGLPAAEAAMLLLAAPDGRMALLLRLARLQRASAAALLAGVGVALGVAEPEAELARFDRFEDGLLAAELAWLGRNPGYRAAVRAVQEADGQRSV